jgi:hypothetical protein
LVIYDENIIIGSQNEGGPGFVSEDTNQPAPVNSKPFGGGRPGTGSPKPPRDRGVWPMSTDTEHGDPVMGDWENRYTSPLNLCDACKKIAEGKKIVKEYRTNRNDKDFKIDWTDVIKKICPQEKRK